jgi:diguanylate cyclase (GGDEF)-like protein
MHADLSIIIVDDMQFSRAVLRSALQKEGYEDIRLAASANDVLDMLRTRSADVVLADWVMPEMNGLELTHAIRQMDEEHNRYTSVIVFTAMEGEEAMMEAFQQGVDDYLTKPVNNKELSARVYAAGRLATLHNTLLQTSSALSVANNYLEEMNTTDPLTGIGNNRYINRQLEAQLLQTHSRGGELCLALVDIDRFQNINNQHSYETGDSILKAFARRLRRAIRPMDVVGRIGADEFALILSYSEPTQFRSSIFDRIRETIRQRPLQTGQGELELTASMGVYCFNGGGDGIETVQEIMQQARKNLREAQQQGSNQIVIS